MALSGNLTTSNYQGRYLKFEWSATQNIGKNTSTISWTLKGDGDASSSWYNSAPFEVTIDGAKVYESSTRIKLYKGTQVASGTKTFTHSTDGKKSFKVEVKGAIYVSSINVSGSKTFTLDDIPRKATITSAPNFNDEGNPTIKYSNLAGNNATTLQACIADTNGSTVYAAYRDITKTGTEYTFNLTNAERVALRKAVTTGTTVNVKFYIKTVIGGVTYYHNVEKTLSLINYTPTLNPTVIDTLAESITLTGDANNKMIKGYNKMSFTANAAGVKEATVKTVTCKYGSTTHTGTTGTFNNVTVKDFIVTVTDSRGNTNSKTVSKTLIDYIPLTCDLKVPLPTTDGETTVSISGNYFNAFLGSKNNTLTVRYKYYEDGASAPSWSVTTATFNGNKYNASIKVTGLDYRKTYVFEANANDLVKSINSTTIKVKTTPVFDWGEDDFNFNCDVTINGNLTVNGSNSWKNLTLNSNFKAYNDVTANTPQYKNNNGVVTVRGIVSPKTAFTSTSNTTVFASGLPEALRPPINLCFICQGSGMNRWLCNISTSGEIGVSRYGITNFEEVPTTAWLTFCLTYVV